MTDFLADLKGKHIVANGVPLPDRKTLSLTGVISASDAPSQDATILNLAGAIVLETIAESTYTVTAEDFGKVKVMAGGATVTWPAGLEEGRAVTFVQSGAAQVTFQGDGTSTVDGADGYTKTRANLSHVVAYNSGSDVIWLVGDLSA